MAVAGLGFGVFALALAGNAFAQGTETSSTREVALERSVMELGPAGLLRRDFVTRGAPPPHANLLPGGALWTQTDEGTGWVGHAVSIGAQGTQVFSEFEFGVDHSELVSGFASDPVTPIWVHPVPMECTNTFVDSAESSDVHVSIHQVVLNGNNTTRQPVVSKYSSHSGTPDWTWNFPNPTAGMSRIAISDDGQRIVAVSLYNQTISLQIAIFGPNSGTPIWYGTIPSFGTQLLGFDLSADGSTLYLAAGTLAYVWDTNTHQTLTTLVLTNASACHAVSGDGRVFAYGGFNYLAVWEKHPDGTYSNTYTRNIPGSYVCGKIDISADDSTIAYAFNGYDTSLHVHIEALDVPTKTVLMSDDAVGTGTYQNVVSDIAIDRDGGRFVVGLWGDQGDVCPEVRLYRSRQSIPAALYNLPGSVFDVDISGDGSRVAVASKAAHANTFSSGGAISLYAFEPGDLRALGAPQIGHALQFQLSGTPNSPARLFYSYAQAATPHVFGNIGTLYLDRSDLHTLTLPNADGGGFTLGSFPIPNSASMIGQTLWFQGLFTSPRRLTHDWTRVTILP